MNVNQVNVAGNLTRDPEVKFLPNGTAVCEASIAINRKWTTDSGEKKEAVTFVGLTIWGKRGEAFAQYLKKGQPVFCSGELHQETWDDKKTGEKKSKTKVRVNDWQFCGGNKPDGQTQQARTATAPRANSAPAQEAPAGEEDPNSGLPF